MKQNPIWLFINPYGWIIIVMSIISAVVIAEWWLVLLGFIGYLIVLVVELMWGGALGRTGRIRLARAEQENRELRDEKSRLVGTINELQQKTPATPPSTQDKGQQP
jgi:hypothetical protein